MLDDQNEEADALLSEILASKCLTDDLEARVKQYLFQTWISPVAAPQYGESPVMTIIKHFAPFYELEHRDRQARGRLIRAMMQDLGLDYEKDETK